MSHPTRGGFFYLPKRLRYSATPKTNLLSRCASVKSVFVSERRISRFGQPIAVANHLQMSCVKDMVEPLLGFCAHLPRIGPLLVVLSSGWDVLALFKMECRCRNPVPACVLPEILLRVTSHTNTGLRRIIPWTNVPSGQKKKPPVRMAFIV